MSYRQETHCEGIGIGMKEAHGLSHELLLIKNVMLRQLLSPEFQPVCSKSP